MVNGLFRRERFSDFGPCGLDGPGHARPTARGRARKGGKLRPFVRADAPRLPGVYGMTDANGELIYVGKAKSLRARLLGYFRPNSRDDKATAIIRETRGLLWEVAPNELAALLRELELIRRWQPRFNVQGQPRRHRRCYVCVGRRPAPYAHVVTKPPRHGECFGPVPGLGRARQAARRLNDWYRLRDCPRPQRMRFAGQKELFALELAPGCLRHEIGQCLAPCAAECSRREYGFHVEAVLDFLKGKDRTPLEELCRRRDEAAAAMEYERAAVLRDRHRSLEWLFNHLERIREAVTHSFVYPLANHDGAEMWYLVRHGLVRAALPAPVCDATRGGVAARLEEVYGPGPAAGAPALDEIDGVLLVAAWFRRHKQERARVLEVEQVRRLLSGAAPG